METGYEVIYLGNGEIDFIKANEGEDEKWGQKSGEILKDMKVTIK